MNPGTVNTSAKRLIYNDFLALSKIKMTNSKMFANKIGQKASPKNDVHTKKFGLTNGLTAHNSMEIIAINAKIATKNITSRFKNGFFFTTDPSFIS